MTPPQRRRRQPLPAPSPPPDPPPRTGPAPERTGPPSAATAPESAGQPAAQPGVRSAAPSGAPSGTPEKDGENKNPERFYVISEADGERAPLDLVTLVVARAQAPSSASPEQSAVLRMCGAPLSVAEVSAYLSLPFSVVTVLLTEMLAAELVQARAPIVRQNLPDRSLLEAVMHGLQRL
ncbi:DUF742 domain-containing protein [Streptomyces antibioticus]|uniref:DUF742 domain-containing protein n=1 Tax=Streptomyces antibioticus TaxID=1890 RepID=A0AAE6Y622_STRAT|nr:hypothetical protein AFM16_08335 [Streptomyces antibioticus]QIT43546.1 DUF742 domain-containing protein [Streptomyces antibioticus]